MAKVGRYVCVAVPFILTVLSLVTLLIACLSGVTNKGLYMFEVDLSELSISPDSINSFLDGRDVLDDLGNIVNEATDGSSGSNVTFSDIGLNEVYKISLWGYCSERADGSDRKCTDPEMNWAASALDTSAIDKIANAIGSDFEIPEEITSALDVFSTVSRWTQIVFIIALSALGAQIVVGMFSACTRIASCLCFLIAGLSTASTIASASLSTATSAVVIGAIEGTATLYGAQGSINTSFLALVWVSVAFAIAASVTWLVTICCCAPDRTGRRDRKNASNEKGFGNSSYQPLQDPSDPYGHGANNSQYSSQSSYGMQQYPSPNARSDLAYEPYSHRA